MDKLRDRYQKDIEKQETVKETNSGNITIKSYTEKIVVDEDFLNARMDGLERPLDCEGYEDEDFDIW